MQKQNWICRIFQTNQQQTNSMLFHKIRYFLITFIKAIAMVWLNFSKDRKCSHDLIGSFAINEGKDEILGLPFTNNAGIVLLTYSWHL